MGFLANYPAGPDRMCFLLHRTLGGKVPDDADRGPVPLHPALALKEGAEVLAPLGLDCPDADKKQTITTKLCRKLGWLQKWRSKKR